MWFCYKQKRKRNTKYHKPSKKTLICQCYWQFPPSFQTATQKSRIGLLHRNQFAEGIQLTWTIISQIYRKKKICQKALKIQNLSLIFVIQTMKFRLLNLKSWSCQLYTRCTKYFWMTSKTVIIWVKSCFLKGKKHKMLQSKS